MRQLTSPSLQVSVSRWRVNSCLSYPTPRNGVVDSIDRSNQYRTGSFPKDIKSHVDFLPCQLPPFSIRVVVNLQLPNLQSLIQHFNVDNISTWSSQASLNVLVIRARERYNPTLVISFFGIKVISYKNSTASIIRGVNWADWPWRAQ